MSADLTALAVALRDFERHVFWDRDGYEWQTANDDPNGSQAAFVNLRTRHQHEIDCLAQLWAADNSQAFGSRNPEYLNDMLERHGVQSRFSENCGVGLVTRFELKPEWMTDVSTCVVRAEDGEPFEGFRIDRNVDFFTTQLGEADLGDPLIRIPIADGWLWLMATKRPASETDLALRAVTILEANRRLSGRHGSRLAMPVLDMTLTSEASWLYGMCGGEQNFDVITDAYQQLTLDLRANVDSNGTVTHGITSETFELNEAFMGFFTRDSVSTLPFGIFYVDPSCWNEPKEAIPV